MAIKRSAPKTAIKQRAPKTPEEEVVDSFISGAAAAPPPELPWRRASDIPVTLNTRIPHRLAAKLEWLKDRKGIAKAAAVEEALSAWVSAELRRYGIREEDE
jgi:hypothetical protein